MVGKFYKNALVLLIPFPFGPASWVLVLMLGGHRLVLRGYDFGDKEGGESWRMARCFIRLRASGPHCGS